MIWHPFNRETAPKDTPIAILSIRPSLSTAGGKYITMNICYWHEKNEEFVLGMGVETTISYDGTHWCEVSDLDLPK
jgi:hypothetical protein